MMHILEAGIGKNEQSQYFETTMQELIFSDEIMIDAPYFEKKIMAFALNNDMDRVDKAYLHGTSEQNMKELETKLCVKYLSRGPAEGIKRALHSHK